MFNAKSFKTSLCVECHPVRSQPEPSCNMHHGVQNFGMAYAGARIKFSGGYVELAAFGNV